MKSSEYWQNRFEQVESLTNSYGERSRKELIGVFNQAQKEIQGEIEKWFGRLAINNKVSIDEARRLLKSEELKEFKWDVQQYIEFGKQNAFSGLWMEELENASAKFHISRLEALLIRVQQAAEKAFTKENDVVSKMAKKVYTEGFYHGCYELQKGFNIGFDVAQVDNRRLNKIINKPWAADGRNFSDRIWQQKGKLVNELHQQLTRTCLLGKAPDQAIRDIAKKFDTTRYAAGRLVMTEQSYFYSVSQKDAFDELGVEEFEFVATLDSHTSQICQDMDGRHFPMKLYEPGVTAPPLHVWCRSVTVPYFNDEFTIGDKRAARDSEGQTYYVPANMKYAEWKDRFVDSYNVISEKDMPIQVGGVDCTVYNGKISFSNTIGDKTKKENVIIYKTQDGTSFIFPKNYDLTKQTMTPDKAIELWYRVPEKIRAKGQKTIEFVDYYNPQDQHWRKIYKNFTYSYATGGDTITFYRYELPHNDDYVIRTYCHEVGHFINMREGSSGINYSNNSLWINAMKDDIIVSGSKSVTEYGENSTDEDFAESIVEFTFNTKAFKKKYPNRFKLIKQLFK